MTCHWRTPAGWASQQHLGKWLLCLAGRSHGASATRYCPSSPARQRSRGAPVTHLAALTWCQQRFSRPPSEAAVTSATPSLCKPALAAAATANTAAGPPSDIQKRKEEELFGFFGTPLRATGSSQVTRWRRFRSSLQ